MGFFTALCLLSILGGPTLLPGFVAYGEEGQVTIPPRELVAPIPEKSPEKLKKPSKGGKRRSDKDAEGTQAADRFEADTVIKSKYQLNGQSLEVDPD